ncbi:hypothetical protein I3843_03G022200 [Carya illinoinensis]|uniref:granule-bound starch synthase 2, chloroplastic/amyloplastic-like isoform X2 n=1 Tax=Carya illinoinensis TaxID=32201 RepID=UPI001C71A2B2|nr:granule-bound starch synthase 2, chloroplastic/amyloplastic-like isoform X2 [Carya illinoinensis]KAG7985368.1 hypothetical protein I3843_03G022200 [Carya illinoinensis]
MASMGFLPFIFETKSESSVLLNSSKTRRPRFPFFAYRPREPLDSSGNTSLSFGYWKAAGEDCAVLSLSCDRPIGGLCRGQQRRITPLKATSKGFVEGEDGGNEVEDAVQATIEKSQKVLAMQKELLQQIAERRKLVSSIKNDLINQEDNEVSGRGNASANLDLLSDSDNAIDERTSSIPSSSYAPLTVDEVPENLPSNSGGDFDEVKKESEKVALLKKASSDPDSTKQLEEANTKEVWSDSLPSFLSSSSESSSEGDGNQEISSKTRLTEVDGETSDPVIEDIKPPPLAGANVMNVILVAAECAPWSKTGGLGDVAGALPKALARRGHRVMVVAPLYGNYAEPQDIGVRKIYRVDRQDVEVRYFHAYIDGVDFVFIESPMFRHMGNNIYGGNRMVPWHVPCGGICYGDGNLVFIANDWHTALLPVYLKAYYRDNGLMKYTRSILVIHNIAYQGRGPLGDFTYVDLPEHYLEIFKRYDPVGGEHFNIFAAGLKTADRIVTVSHGYAWELKTPEGGWGLHGIINENDWKLRGIVNGIDMKDWNPQFDVYLASDGYINYSIETLKTGKRQCKEALQRELGLPIREDVPVIGFIGRLDGQKGVDLIAEAIPWMAGQDVQLIMLGTGRPDLEQLLKQFENQHHDKIRGWVGFSVKTAHRITAGSDILLMPSRFEPCGLNQLYAMSYGTVPVVHAVGGLRDTVQPFDPFNESGLGWTFDSADANKLIHALGNCLLTYREYKQSWEGLQKRGMMQDLSWDNAAQNYEEVLIAAKYQW